MFQFPIHLFNPGTIKLQLTGRTISGGEALSGDSDTIATDGGGRWVATMTGIALMSIRDDLSDIDLLRAWRAWEAHLANGVTRCVVPVADTRQAPRPIIGGVAGTPSDLHAQSDDPYFPETLGFASPFVVAQVAVPAPLRATEVAITMMIGARLRGGEHFSIDHPSKGRRLYRIERVTFLSGSTATVRIVPPLREAVGGGENADFDWPSFVATLVPDTDIAPDLAYGDDATVAISFRETFT